MPLLGRLRDALVDCNEALQLKPDYIDALDSRGFVELRMGRYHAVDRRLRRGAENRSPSKITSLYGRGMAKRRKGDYAAGNADIAAARKHQARL